MTVIEKLLTACMEAGIGIDCIDGQLKLTIPKGVDATALVGQIRDNKAGLVEYIVRMRQAGATGAPQRVANNGNTYPVFYNQEKSYRRFQVMGEGSFNMHFLMPIPALNRPALEKALQILTDRHESLRTNYIQKDNICYQHILDAHPIQGIIEYHDVSEQENPGSAAEQILSAALQYVYQLEKELLFCIKLVKVQPDLHVLFFILDHVNGDAASINILRQEMEQLYTACATGVSEPASLMTPAWQYKDYSAWINQWLGSERGQTARQFFHTKMTESLIAEYGPDFFSTKPYSYRAELLAELTQLNRAKDPSAIDWLYGSVVSLLPRPGARYNAYLGETLLGNLEKTASRLNSSVNRLVMIAFALAMTRLYNRNSVRICTPLSTRAKEAFEAIVGWLISEVIICITIDPQENIAALVARADREFLETSEHGYYPHAAILADTDMPLSILAHLFINFINNKTNTLTATESIHQENGSGYFSFRCDVLEYRNGLELAVNYNTDFYDPTAVTNLIHLVKELLQQISEQPSLTVSALLPQELMNNTTTPHQTIHFQ
jgi:hypothetical protein